MKRPPPKNQGSAIMFSDTPGVIQFVNIFISGCYVMFPMLGTEPLTPIGNIQIFGYFHIMSMTGIVVNGPSYGALINCVHLGTLESVDNMQSLFKGPHKVLLEVKYGNVTTIANTNRKSIGIKIILTMLASGVGCTSHEIYVRQVAGGKKSDIILDVRQVGLLT